jgi:hypothetical protein
MKPSRPGGLLLLVSTLMAFSVAVAQNLPDSGQSRARRPGHPHEGPTPRAGGRYGDPLPGRTPAQLADFTAGLGEFESVEDAEGGLGPIFNNSSCVIGGSLLQEKAIDPGVLEKVPEEATLVVHRQSTPLFGAGLIEAIPDQTIQELAKRKKADGVLGRVALVPDIASGAMRVGKFGWKAQQATLLAFAGDA